MFAYYYLSTYTECKQVMFWEHKMTGLIAWGSDWKNRWIAYSMSFHKIFKPHLFNPAYFLDIMWVKTVKEICNKECIL